VQQAPIFLSGRVMLDDGAPPDRDIRIERVCGGMSRIEGRTDSKGRFSFQLGQNSASEMDASESSMGGFGRGMPTGSMGSSGLGDRGTANLWNCELRASYPGYRSDVVQLGGRRALDSPDVGTIVLHHLGNVQGTTISLTTALAPKDARKEYEKGLQLSQRGKFDEAMSRFSHATELYPKYAIAWYALGQLQQKQGHGTEARGSYEKALAADSRYVSPLNQMSLLAAQEGKWDEAAKFSKQAISLNPVEFPSAFWYNALANYNLKRPEDASKSTKDLLKLDTRHNYPEAENLMAQLLLESGNYSEAATHLRSYLTLVPNAKNADVLKQMLLKIDAAKATTPALGTPEKSQQ
jgi:tetratricopeptide (TPR) repeat protein